VWKAILSVRKKGQREGPGRHNRFQADRNVTQKCVLFICTPKNEAIYPPKHLPTNKTTWAII
jgi:hypothetical protein